MPGTLYAIRRLQEDAASIASLNRLPHPPFSAQRLRACELAAIALPAASRFSHIREQVKKAYTALINAFTPEVPQRDARSGKPPIRGDEANGGTDPFCEVLL